MLTGAAAARIAMRPAYELADYPLAECSPLHDAAANGRVFYVDPLRGSVDGDGSRERPWNDLQALVDEGLIGERKRFLTLPNRLLAALIHRPSAVRSASRDGAVVRSGDVIRLASGGYGAIDLSGLSNAGFVTIEAAPGARPRFTGLNAAGASYFIVRGIAISGAEPVDGGRYLLTTREPSPRRVDNFVFEDIEISWRTRAYATDPATFAAHAPDGANVSAIA
ncbi:hypothetical protein [Erythrobacter sp.]|uniref:hypothetical protein n=1 Tax=Erythrobacter sp. TaxID=1042 RepID=UPI0032EF3E72